MADTWSQAAKELADWMKMGPSIVVPFIGAGVSRAAGLPTWSGLSDAIVESTYGFGMASQLEVQEAKARDPLSVLTFCRERLGDEMFRRQVARILTVPQGAAAPEIARLCWRLNADLVVTTNLDDVLERASSADGASTTALTPADSLSMALQSPGRRVLHLHGVVPRVDTWVMTDQDYDRAVGPTSPIGASLQTILMDRVLLFIGYSCSDPDLTLFLDRFRDAFPKGTTQHYAILPTPAPEQRRKLLDYGIFIIEYSPSNSSHPEVMSFLESVFAAYDPSAAEHWADQQKKQPTPAALATNADLHAMSFGPRRDKLNQEFTHLFDQAVNYGLAGESELPPTIRQRRTEVLESLAGAWQVDTVPPLNAIDGREIVKDIGRGGFGVVWLAEDVRTRERQALKVAHFQETTNFKFVERFKQGIRAMRKLTMYGVANTTKYLHHREVPLCVFMEYVDGGDLSELIQHVELDAAARLRLGRDICQIVASAHKVPVYHRDLKPSNVLVRWDERAQPQVVLSDFDLAWFEGAISKTTTRIGDQAFASPEQLREARTAIHARAESDVYSLAMLLWFLISKRMPTAGQWYNQGLREEVFGTALREFSWITTAQGVADLIVKCAREAPADRPSAEYVAQECERLFGPESTNMADGATLAAEVRYRVAKEHSGTVEAQLHGLHVEHRKDAGKPVIQAAFARQLTEADDRGRFKQAADKDVAAVKKSLESNRWSVVSVSATPFDAKLVVRHVLDAFTLDVAVALASQLADALRTWCKRC